MTLCAVLANTRSKFSVRSTLFAYCSNIVSKRCRKRLIETRYSEVARSIADIMKPDPNHPPPTIKLSVLGNGSLGNPSCVYLFTDNKRYLFNCGEGVQRLAGELQLKLVKLDNIFITRTTWDKFGGLPGMSMTIKSLEVNKPNVNDVKPKLTLHGPSDLVELYNMTKYFGVDSMLTVAQHDYSKSTFSDSVMEVHRVELSPKEKSCQNENSESSPKKRKTTSEDVVFCYICDFHEKPGELLINKCIELKVPRGPLLGKLKSGEDVTLPDGRTIMSKDVVGKSEKGPILFVIDCPSQIYLKNLLSTEILPEYRQKCKAEERLSAVIHFTPSTVANSAEYQEFIASFPEDTFHVYINEKSPSLSNTAQHKIQTQLNIIDDKFHPLLHYTTSDDCDSSKKEPIGLKLILRPKDKAGFEKDSTVNFDGKAIFDETWNTLEFAEAVVDYKEKCATLQSKKEEYPEIIFMGTGSAAPSKYRNSSCILVKIDEDTTLMMDCGEGSYGQLTRYFGNEIESELKKLKAIYVSHYHADHHIGVIDVLRNRESLNLPPLPLIVPDAVSSWLNSYSNAYESISHLYKIYPSFSFRSPSNSPSLLKSLKLQSLVTVKVPHCKDSMGVIFRTEKDPSYKIVYSGDAMPSTALIQEGQNCDILIHEATMEDDLEEEAFAKRHSTISQAINVGWKMRAKTTIVTHFSQRYAKLPKIPEDIMKNVGIAFDNMRIRVCDVEKLPLLVKPLLTLYAEEYQEMCEKINIRMQRKQVLKESVS